MNFVSTERVWTALLADADFQVVDGLPKKDILIIAPHPDDEIFACSGALLKASENQKIKIVYIFSGDRKSHSPLAIEREEESKKAVALLAGPNQVFFRLSNNSLVPESKISELANIIVKFNPGIIMMPRFFSMNSDHVEAAKAAIESLKVAKINGFDLKKISIWLYGIWSPLSHFNRLLEFDWSKKEKAMEKFLSQHKDRNYIKAIKSLDEYYGEIYGLAKPAEAFFALPADLLLKVSKEKK